MDQADLLVAPAVIGAYMALNIDANDVANNVGPAVGSYALTLTGAIVIAAIFEASGAIIAGGDVVSMAKKGIIDPADIENPEVFVWVMTGALLRFAHVANDVANLVDPLPAIVDILTEGTGSAKVAIPLWIMVIGAVGILVGFVPFGPKLIRTVGSEITEPDRSRAFCIALAAALTVIVASQLGPPVSSTYVGLGPVFGVGFLREFLEKRMGKVVEQVLVRHKGKPDFVQAEEVLRPSGMPRRRKKHRCWTSSIKWVLKR